MNKIVIGMSLAFLAMAPAFANDFSGKSGGCNALLCSARQVADFEKEAKRLEKTHPTNVAVKELVHSLEQKPAQGKRAELAKFFAFHKEMDATDKQKAIERRLNDGQSDKLTNAEIDALVAILEGQTE